MTTDAELAYELGKHAAEKAFQSMVTVWMTVPEHLRSAAMAMSIAYTLHKADGAMHPSVTGNTDFRDMVEQMRAALNENLDDLIRQSKAIAEQRRAGK